MKKLLLLLLLVSLSYCYANDYFDNAELSAPKVKMSRLDRMSLHAGKSHSSEDYRYMYHITNREYLDCSKYSLCDCKDIRFSRCWQCKDYAYAYVKPDYK